MKKKRKSSIILVILLALGLLMSCGVPIRPHVDSNEFTQRMARMELVTRMKLSTVKLGKPIRATGILLRQGESSSLLLIAGHSARLIKAAGGSIATAMIGSACHIKIVAISDKFDLGLARTKCRLPGVPAKIAARPIELGETVYVLGHTLGQPYTLTKGIVSNTQRMKSFGVNSKVFVQVDAHSLIGNSGGPLFNVRGEVVGVISGGSLAPIVTPFGYDQMRSMMVAHMALCVPLQHVRNFLAKQGVL